MHKIGYGFERERVFAMSTFSATNTYPAIYIHATSVYSYESTGGQHTYPTKGLCLVLSSIAIEENKAPTFLFWISHRCTSAIGRSADKLLCVLPEISSCTLMSLCTMHTTCMRSANDRAFIEHSKKKK